ncbi:Asp/Glu/hydantoin racemase [Fulvimarina endophytica]|uniref:Asp/Glu/hydantoin racemase n=1 Tax=Fulvimarina endophytica TaxID=2293836 RepID=A0A371X9R3_9HYPH|nr:aspartate/glutamate racemase family protein [Fulvimarina endophytica]RFC65977.1 Asp/Glu/hydantoin racemase [Fulvimarina endophytica]
MARIGFITPSSNTVLEPETYRMLAGVDGVTVHFARFQVLKIATDDDALNQFDLAPQLAAAESLADCRPDVIAWCGTSGGWMGLERDRALCAAITERTGCPATTSTLAQIAAFRELGAHNYALVTPYLSTIQSRIVETFGDEGFACVAEEHLEDPGNFSFSTYGPDVISAMVRRVAEKAPDAISIFCTNFDGVRIAPLLERELGIPVIDSTALTLWHSLVLAGLDPAIVGNQGVLFQKSGAGSDRPTAGVASSSSS